MSNAQQLAFKITADAESARAEIRRAAEAVRDLGRQGGPAAQGLAPLGRATTALGGAARDTDGAIGAFGRSLAAVPGPVGTAANSLSGLTRGLAGMPPLFVAASVAGTAFGAAIALALGRGITAWREYERQMLTTEQVIRATGGAAGRSWQDIDGIARQIGQATLASTAEVRQAGQQLLTFRSIAGETFDRTLWAAQDLAATGFGSITSAVQALGRALEDPEQGLDALRRSNVRFTASQQEVIRSLVQTGQVAEAQRLILEKVEQQVGGAGREAGAGLSGAFDGLTENMGRFFEIVGEGTARLTQLQGALEWVARGFQGWNNILSPPENDQWREVIQLEARLAELRTARDEIVAGGMAASVPTVANQLAAIESQISQAEARVAELQERGRAQILADADKRAQSQREQAAQAQERFDAVIDGLRREGEQAGLTATELRVLNEARRAGVAGNAEAVAKIRELVQANEALKNSQRANELLGQLQAEIELRQTILAYGEDSAEATRVRAEQERAAFQATLDALGVTGQLRDELTRAWEAARGLAATDMAGPIARARAEARGMAGEIMAALGAVQQLQAQSADRLVDAQLRLEFFDDPVRLAGEIERRRMIAAQGVRRQGAEGGELAGLDAEVNAAVRAAEEIERRVQERMERTRNARSTGGGGGGAAATNALQQMSAEGARILAELDIALGAINEKVQAGLMSSAEGVQAIATANQSAAEQMATLVARLEAIGPAGAAAAEQARAALRGLAEEARRTGDSLQERVIDSFEDAFARSLANGRNMFSSFVDFLKFELAKAFTQKFITPLITPLINALMKIFDFVGAKGGVPGAPELAPFANGGVPGLANHRNTIVDQPTIFPMPAGGLGLMGEAGPEAIMPLARGGVRAQLPGGRETIAPLTRMSDGTLGVIVPSATDLMNRPLKAFARGGIFGDERGPGSTAGPVGAGWSGVTGDERGPGARVVVNINNNASGTRVEAQERQEGGSSVLDIMIEQVESALADRMGRGMGPLSGVLGANFGLRRQGQ